MSESTKTIEAALDGQRSEADRRRRTLRQRYAGLLVAAAREDLANPDAVVDVGRALGRSVDDMAEDWRLVQRLLDTRELAATAEDLRRERSDLAARQSDASAQVRAAQVREQSLLDESDELDERIRQVEAARQVLPRLVTDWTHRFGEEARGLIVPPVDGGQGQVTV